MSDLSFTEILEMQTQLQEKYKGRREPITPETGRNKLLWMLGEAGEVIDILKKDGTAKIMADESTRAHFVEEMADVLMYYGDVMLCYGMSAEELKAAYADKFQRNMKRW